LNVLEDYFAEKKILSDIKQAIANKYLVKINDEEKGRIILEINPTLRDEVKEHTTWIINTVYQSLSEGVIEAGVLKKIEERVNAKRKLVKEEFFNK